jgi:hypothetical protein
MAATSSKPSSIGPRRPPKTRMVQNFHLLWLDASIDEDNNDDCHNSITKLRQIVNTVKTFTDADKCVDFITDIKKENTLMIVSEALGQIVVPVVQDIVEVSSVYIFCAHETRLESSIK